VEKVGAGQRRVRIQLTRQEGGSLKLDQIEHEHGSSLYQEGVREEEWAEPTIPPNEGKEKSSC